MDCHGNNNGDTNKNGNSHKEHLSHILMMALCFGAPIIIVMLVPLVGNLGIPGVSKAMLRIAPFLCPLMMLFMMPMMFKGGKGKDKDGCCGSKQRQSEEQKQPNEILKIDTK